MVVWVEDSMLQGPGGVRIKHVQFGPKLITAEFLLPNVPEYLAKQIGWNAESD